MRPDLPAWIRELDIALPVFPQVVITGNVRDIYFLPPDLNAELPGPDDRDKEKLVPLDLAETIELVCRSRDYGGLGWFDPIHQAFALWPLQESVEFPPSLLAMAAEDSITSPAAGQPGGGPGGSRDRQGQSHADRLYQILTDLVRQRGPSIGLMFPYAASAGTADPDDEAGRRLYALIEALADTAKPVPGPRPVMPYNTIFWVAERQEDMPPDFPLGNRAIRVITIPDPPVDQRLAAARHAVANIAKQRGPEADTAAVALADETHAMRNTELLKIAAMAVDQGIPADRLYDAARLYRVGVLENPWALGALRTKIASAEDYLNARVVGQRDAVRKTVEIFKRSAAGLTGAQSASSPDRPRGVLFLAGPTGVGKTELAKGIATLIFGPDARPVRFDMSELGQEHARDRLIGAPPGYVGHNAGGELTNAVRRNPMSVLLFDEIDKAHKSVFDLFLQILEDGRLTDGRGATVYFTECILIFTSNLGVEFAEPGGNVRRLTHADEPSAVRDALKLAFENFFDKVIGRPEVRNRFGNGFVCMDFIQADMVPAILDKALQAVADRVEITHGARLVIGDQAREVLRQAAIGHLDHGGRGVNNLVEDALVNPLSGELFDRPAVAGEEITIEGIVPEGDDGWRLEVGR